LIRKKKPWGKKKEAFFFLVERKTLGKKKDLFGEKKRTFLGENYYFCYAR